MKIKEGYILRQVAGENIVIPAGEDLDLNLMISLNDTGSFLWKRLETGAGEEELVRALLEEYEVEEPRARASVEAFLARLREHGCLEP